MAKDIQQAAAEMIARLALQKAFDEAAERRNLCKDDTVKFTETEIAEIYERRRLLATKLRAAGQRPPRR
jgi:hypothetical protein